jgi:uncharacterized SAM-binding protein YcdF (DUF218 family)
MKTKIIKLLFNKNKLTDYVFIDNNINLKDNYDIALVLGCSNYDILMKRVESTLDLYNKKIIKKILLSGGKHFFKKKEESLIMKDYLLSNNVKEEDIIVETKSKSTISNIKNSLKILNNMYKDNINILLVTSSFHIKRSKYLLEKLSKYNVFIYPVNDNICDKDVWMNTKKGRKLIRREAISLYLETKE